MIQNFSAPVADLPGGALYMVNRTIKNTGKSPLHDLVIGLTLPGVPVVAYSDRSEVLIDVGLSTIRVFNFSNELEPIAHAYRDPRLLRPRSFKEQRIRMPFVAENATITMVTGYIWVGDQTVVGATGTQTMWYRLSVLRSGKGWVLKTIHFGEANDPASVEVITGSAEAYDRIPIAMATRLPSFGPNATEGIHIDIIAWPTGGFNAIARTIIPFWK